MALRPLRLPIAVLFLTLRPPVAAAADDEAAIDAVLTSLEAAIARDDVGAVMDCLAGREFVQIYDFDEGGPRFDRITWWQQNPEWLGSNEYVKLEGRQIEVDRNIAHVRFIERSRHRNGTEMRYRALWILVKRDGRWRVAVAAGRQI